MNKKGCEMRVNRRAVLSASGIAAVSLAAPASAANDSAAMKAAAQRFVDEVLNGGNVAVIDELYAENYESSNPDDAPGRDAYKTRLGNKIETDGYLVTDTAFSVESMATNGGDLLLRGFVTGTSTRAKKIKALYFMQFRFKDGLVVTDWMLRDEASMMGMGL